MKVLGVTGMPGCGKSEAMGVARERGLPVVRMGDLIWEEVERRGLPRDAQNVGRVADAMRKEEGDDVWALRTVHRVKDLAREAPIVVIDGVRSDHEVGVFRREFGGDFVLVAIQAETRQRHDRMSARAREDDPRGADAAAGHQARDEREMSWGIGRTIATADRTVVNDGSLDTFRRRIGRLLDEFA